MIHNKPLHIHADAPIILDSGRVITHTEAKAAIEAAFKIIEKVSTEDINTQHVKAAIWLTQYRSPLL